MAGWLADWLAGIAKSYLISDDNQKFSVVIGTLPSIFVSCECHSKLSEEMHIPLRLIPKDDSLRR